MACADNGARRREKQIRRYSAGLGFEPEMGIRLCASSCFMSYSISAASWRSRERISCRQGARSKGDRAQRRSSGKAAKKEECWEVRAGGAHLQVLLVVLEQLSQEEEEVAQQGRVLGLEVPAREVHQKG